MAQPPKIYIPGPLRYMWNYLSWRVDDFKAYFLGYKCYRASISQTGTDAPVVTVLENSLGISVEYIYGAPGIYLGLSSEDLFAMPTESIAGKKVDVFITPSAVVHSDEPIVFSAYPIFVNAISLSSYNIATSLYEDQWLGGLNPTTFEIRVYNK